MKWTERVQVVDILHDNPDLFWVLMHIAWGSIYGAITLAVVIVTLAGARQLKSTKPGRLIVFSIQTIWSITMLSGVFAVPLLFNLIDNRVMINGKYVAYWFMSWGLSCLIYYWCFRKLQISFA